MNATGPARIFWLVGDGEMPRRVRLSTHNAVLVGRAAQNHLVLNDYRISRQHARVTYERDGFLVYDLNSANGTFVNGEPVGREPIRIRENDRLAFGPHMFHVFSTPGHPDSALMELAAANGVTVTEEIQPRLPRDRSFETRKTIPPEVGYDPIEVPLDERTMLFNDDVLPTAPRSSSRFRAHIEPVDLNTLESAYNNLQTLYAFMEGIIKTIDRRELLELIARKVLDIFPAAASCAIYVPNIVAGPLTPPLFNGAPPAPPQPLVAPTSFHLAQYVGDPNNRAPVLNPATTLAALAARRPIFEDDLSPDSAAGAVMCVALMDSEQPLGILTIATRGRKREFTAADLALLNGISGPAAIMMQNARMHEESLLRKRMNRDLELAAQIQKSFLPQEVLTVRDVEFLAMYRAAYTVGGDFYDVFWVAPDTLAVFVGDIAGKGIAAALLMARISGELRVAAHAHVDPVHVLSVMNRAVINHGQSESFFTAGYYTYNVKTGEVHLASAGNPFPYVCRANGSVEVIRDGASGAVGMLEDMQFVSTRLTLADGDSLVLYTDGIVEAAARDGKLFGDERLDACLRGSGPRPKDISDHVLRGVGEHTEGTPASDDMTLFICQRRTGAPPSLQPKRSNTVPIMRAV